MTADERELKRLVARRLPSHLESVAARDRVLNELRATPPHLQKARLADPAPAVSWVRTALPLAAAAAIIVFAATVSFRNEWLATVEAADGSQSTLKPNTVLSANDPRGLQLTLKDGARVEMRSRSELSLEAATDGIGIRLLAGDIIVNAVEQRDRHLSVQTRDMSIAVAGTTSLVKTVEDGSRVAAIAGTVRVHEGGFETVLHPGEQFSTSPTLAARPLRDDIVWSRNADAHLAILESFRRGIAQTSGPLTPVVPVSERQHGNATVAPATVEFEEASIRSCDPDNLPPPPPGARGGGANSFQMTPGRLYALCMTPAVMVRIAHGFTAMPDGSLSADTRRGRGWSLNQVSGQGANSGIAVRGGPDWARNDRYSIEAVAATESDADTMSGPMFRALLERRFKLKTHLETEDVPVWTLTVAPGGLKIKPMAPDGCDQMVPAPGTRTRPRPLDDVQRGAKPTCGVWAAEPSGGAAAWMVGGGTMEDFAGRLRSLLSQARIADKTGVTDHFNFIFEFTQDDQGSIVSALGRLGLRLEQSRTAREFLVIDSIERPGPISW